jgi:hypothetical protein
MQYSVSITTYNRERKGRSNYFKQAFLSYIESGLLACKHISSIDIFVGHERDEWSEKTIPDAMNTHYLDPNATHLDNIEAVFKHVIDDDSVKYHLYLEDDLKCIDFQVFDKIAYWQENIIPNQEAFGVFMDYKPISITSEDRQRGYRRASFNTFTAIMMFKDRIRDFMRKGGYPRARRPEEDIKAPDHYFGKKVMQPTFIAVPSKFIHIGLESAAHKRCFDKPLGV